MWRLAFARMPSGVVPAGPVRTITIENLVQKTALNLQGALFEGADEAAVTWARIALMI